MTPRIFLLLACCALASFGPAQSDTLGVAPWLDREFRYWQGLPPMHVQEPTNEGYIDTEVMGYTDEDRRMSFFRDHRYQEIIFEDKSGVTLRMWQPGDCDPLQGDTVAVLTGTWVWANDTLHVTVERTAQYPLEALLAVYMKRYVSRPFTLPMPPTRECNTERERRFWFEGRRLAEAVRTWD
ncbi:MAG: hypothetical protein JNL05_00035 [Flavobacteriales bacterium]|nr:hypothetical protein [Flavobacteriales bacterium]